MKRLNFICLLLLLLIVPNHVLAVNEVNVYLFYQDSCDICKQEKVYLEALKERYPNMRVYSYEVGDSSNYEMMQKAKNLYQETRSGVPFTVIGDSSYLGYISVVFWHRRKRLCLLKLLFILAFAEELLLVLAHILMFLSMRCSCETEPCLILKVIS